jgi:NADP-dependent alcohol dehydrogenase
MKNFEFYNPVRIVFGKGQLEKLKVLLPKQHKILLLYGGGSILKNGVYDQIINATKGFSLIEFGGIEPNPSHETCMKAIDVIRKEKIEFLLAAGGGSVIDATKYISAAVYFQGDPWKILSGGADIDRAMPFGTILTLPATGTEMNANSVISRKSTNEKLAFSNVLVMPQFSILDPAVAASLPANQVANGIVDTFVHVMEQYMTYPTSAPLQDRMAESILLTLIEEGPKVYADPANYDAMANLMWCSAMALNGLISRGVSEDWVTHMIGHELTAFHGIDHARTLAVVLPGVWKTFHTEKKEKLIQYAERVWGIVQGSDDRIIEQAIDKTVEFFESLGIGTRLSNYKIKEDTIEKIAERFASRNWMAIGDRELTTPAKVREILSHQL